MENVQASELTAQAARLYQDAKALLLEGGAENLEKAEKMVVDAKGLAERANKLSEIEAALSEQKETLPPGEKAPRNVKNFGGLNDFLGGVFQEKKRGRHDPRLAYIKGDTESTNWVSVAGNVTPAQKKEMVENIGADGGFLVPEEFLPQLFMLSPFGQYVRERALTIPMRHRQVKMPTLDQTGTTAGTSNVYGGVDLQWTEEAEYKDETQSKFRQVSLIAHKLAAVTVVSDELLEDSAIELEALLTRLFAGATMNEHDFTFIQGTGAGQPLGVVTANAAAGLGPTIVVARQAANQIQVADIFNMLASFTGSSPIWLAHQATMPQILGLAGPAGNPSYVWINNLRDGAPMTLMGYPIFFIENAPTLGNAGDLILADWSKYLIGARKEVTIDASTHVYFRYDETMWRCVSRIDGRPWLCQPLTLRDGVTQVSPFVILGGAGAS